jgi:hypothetical protein
MACLTGPTSLYAAHFHMLAAHIIPQYASSHFIFAASEEPLFYPFHGLKYVVSNEWQQY